LGKKTALGRRSATWTPAACAKAELQNDAPYWNIQVMAAKLIVGRPFRVVLNVAIDSEQTA